MLVDGSFVWNGQPGCRKKRQPGHFAIPLFVKFKIVEEEESRSGMSLGTELRWLNWRKWDFS